MLHSHLMLPSCMLGRVAAHILGKTDRLARDGSPESRLLHWRGLLLDPAMAPLLDRLDHGRQALPFVRQTVLDAHRRIGIDAPLDYLCSLQLLQPLREHPVAYNFDLLGDLAEAARPCQ